MADWHYEQNGARKGPVDEAALRTLADAGVVTGDTLVWREGLAGWEPAFRHVPGLVPGVPGAARGPVGYGRGGYGVAGGRDYHEPVGMGTAVSRFFSRYLDFAGRSNRGEYWWAVLGLFLIGLVVSAIDAVAFGGAEGRQPLSAVWGLVTFIPYLSLGVRRLHDLDRTGWWIVAPTVLLLVGAALVIAPLAAGGQPGALPILFLVAGGVMGIVLLVWACTRGTSGPNRFG